MATWSLRPVSGGMSLERRIPLLITGLLVIVLSLTFFAAYQEVRRSAILAGRERLDRLSREFGDIARNSVAQRLSLMSEVAADDAVRAVLRSDTRFRAAAIEALDRLRSDSDAILSVQLVSSSTFDPVLEIRSTISIPKERLDFPPSGGYGGWFEQEGRPFAIAGVPVEDGGEVIGYLVQPRPFGDPNGDGDPRDFFGSEASMYAVDGAGSWAMFGGYLRQVPDVDVRQGPLTYAIGGTRYLGHAVTVQESGWVVVAEDAIDNILARPASFVREIAIFLLSIVVAGAVGAWLLSRRFTGPIVTLAEAARSLAGGDYGHRVRLDRPDELGILADSFNRMGAAIQTAHSGLQQNVEQARALADELEIANGRLHEMMEVAEQGQRSAEEASRAKSMFLAMVSHELRTPINAIIGYADLLLLGIPKPATQHQIEYLERLRRNGLHLTRLIDDLLDLAKIEAGQLGIHQEVLAGHDVLEASLSIVEPLAAEKGIEIHRSWNPEQCRFVGDARRVEQILVNLLGNAVKFTAPGGRVELACSNGDTGMKPNGGEPFVLLTVTDSGVGIPSDKLEVIFERFVQGESGFRRSCEGAGLGLAISRELSRLMGGDVTVESVEGHGSCFTLRLPAPTSDQREPLPAAASSDRPGPLSSPADPVRIDAIQSA